MYSKKPDSVPFNDARNNLTELAKEAKNGQEKVLTVNGADYVALIDAAKLDYYHALEEEVGNISFLGSAIDGLEQIARGEVLSDSEADKLLGRE